jgi:uncharacterized membrane protein
MSQFFGQFHPLILHLPIGIWTIAYIFKWLSLKDQDSVFNKTLPILLLVILLSSFFTSLSGYLLSLSGAYEEELVDNHKLAGIALTIISGLIYWLIKKDKFPKFQLSLWIASAPVLFITGHWGGSLTHGEDYLSFSNKVYEKPVIENIQEALVYTDIIEPIFAEKCWACHSAKKQKGELRLDGEKWILEGGENGQVLIAHQSKESDLYQRLILDKSDDDHMPPSRKPQLTEEETKLIAWWIDSGMDFEKRVQDVEQTPEIQSILTQLVRQESSISEVDLPTNEIPQASQAAIQLLQNARISIVPVAQNSNYLAVNLLGKTLPDSLWEVIKTIAPNIVQLKANGCQLGDKQWVYFPAFNNLRRLDLSQSNVSDSSLAYIASLVDLGSLNLSKTVISNKGIELLKPLQNLKSLYLFNSNIDKTKWAEIQSFFPETKIDSGNYRVPILKSDTTILTKEALAKSME